MSELNGLIKYVLWRKSGRWPEVVNIQTIKKWVGAVKKDEMRVKVYKKFSKEFRTTDEVDAFALTDFAWHVLCMREGKDSLILQRDLMKYELDTITINREGEEGKRAKRKGARSKSSDYFIQNLQLTTRYNFCRHIAHHSKRISIQLLAQRFIR